jgi:hypothetical protein
LELEIIENKYLLFILSEWTLLAEYEANSDIGKKLLRRGA